MRFFFTKKSHIVVMCSVRRPRRRRRHAFQTLITLAVFALETSNLICRRLVAVINHFHQNRVRRSSRLKMAAKKPFSREKVIRQRISETAHAREPKPVPFERPKDEDEQVCFGFCVRPLVQPRQPF